MINFLSGLILGFLLGWGLMAAFQYNPPHDLYRQHEIEKMRE